MYGVGQPVAYLFAMGVGLATLVEANGAGGFGGVSYLTFIAPGPADLGRRHDGRQRVHLPGDGRLQVAARLLRPARLAADAGADRLRPDHRRDRALPAAVGHLLRRGRAVRRLARRLGLGCRSSSPSSPACPSACRSWPTRPPSRTTRASSPWSCGSSSCRCSCSPARSSRWTRCRSACAGSAGSHRSGTGPSSAAWSATGYEEAAVLTVVHFVFLLVLTVAGWVLTKRQFVKRMGG